jgi:hypothetical protein
LHGKQVRIVGHGARAGMRLAMRDDVRYATNLHEIVRSQEGRGPKSGVSLAPLSPSPYNRRELRFPG